MQNSVVIIKTLTEKTEITMIFRTFRVVPAAIVVKFGSLLFLKTSAVCTEFCYNRLTSTVEICKLKNSEAVPGHKQRRIASN